MQTETINWNEASDRGLIVRINTEILHPLGLAMYRNVEDGTSPHLLVSDDGVWTYAEAEQVVSVPREPTQEMIEALKAELLVTSRGGILRAGIALTKAIAAAPPTQRQGKPVAVVMPKRMNEHDAVQKLLGRFGVYGVVPADVATDIYNSALADVAKLNEVQGE